MSKISIDKEERHLFSGQIIVIIIYFCRILLLLNLYSLLSNTSQFDISKKTENYFECSENNTWFRISKYKVHRTAPHTSTSALPLDDIIEINGFASQNIITLFVILDSSLSYKNICKAD